MTEQYIITSALPYINGVKHLGNLVGSLLPADVYTRYLKLKGKDVIYICGTDDHGTPAELSALGAGKSVEEYCNEMYEVQKEIYENFGLKFDYFGRTSDVENHEITQEIFLALHQNGFIKENESQQLYSEEDTRFLPDRYVQGTCPHCGYDRARGDQCENCTTLLDPLDLINPQSVISGTTNITTKKVKHLYIDLPKLQPQVEAWIETQNHWPLTSLSIAKKWLKEGLKERSITRNLKWGISVPLEGYEDVVFYVWFDAPIGYISIAKKWASKIVNKPELFDKYWKSKNTKLIQFMGIDNVPFHSVTFPCSLLGSDLDYQLVHTLKGFQWLTFEKGKFSTSQNRGVFTDAALELFPADYWRYYLLLIAPERQDTDFQWKGFQSAVNNDLNNLLGNLVNRFVTFSDKYFDNTIPDYEISPIEEKLHNDFNILLKEYVNTFDQIEFQKPLKALRKFWQDCNRYFQESEPWNTIKDNKEKTAATVSTIGHALRSIALLFAPFAPSTSEKIYEILGLRPESVHEGKLEDFHDWQSLIGNNIKKPKSNLFSKISDKEIKKLQDQYGSANILHESVKKSVKKTKKSSKKKKSEKISYEEFAKINMITARVVKVEPHPEADKLLVLTVDDGKRTDRTIVAGIAQEYEPKALINKTIIIVDNLKARKLKGIKSEGMLLAAEGPSGVHILTPDAQVASGLKIQ